MKRVQDAIKEYLKDTSISQTELAQKCGWPEAKLYGFLNNSNRLSSADYGELCSALGVRYSRFVYSSRGIQRE